MTFVLASNNEDKLKELRTLISEFGLDVLSQSEAGFSLDVEETGVTFHENALLKAKAAAGVSGKPAIADDSGLMVDALGGQPGVWSKRYGGGGLNDEERNALLLKNLAEIAPTQEQRAAKFVSAIACVFPNGDVIAAEGYCSGSILHAPRGCGGFGYDPVFLVDGTDMSMAELTAEEKNRVSHRGNALRIFIPKLKEYLKETGEATC